MHRFLSYVRSIVILKTTGQKMWRTVFLSVLTFLGLAAGKPISMFTITDAPRGILESPGYEVPGHYPANAEVVWELTYPGTMALLRHDLHLFVEYMDVEAAKSLEVEGVRVQNSVTGACADYLKIERDQINQRCGLITQMQEIVVDAGYTVRIEFHTDGTVQGRGFKIYYEFVNTSGETNK